MIARTPEPPDESDDGTVSAPSAEEIRARSAAIRKNWSKRTRKRRRVSADPDPVTVPFIRLADIPSVNEKN